MVSSSLSCVDKVYLDNPSVAELFPLPEHHFLRSFEVPEFLKLLPRAEAQAVAKGSKDISLQSYLVSMGHHYFREE